MASRIQGITVEIGGDTTKLSKALEGVNKSIKGREVNERTWNQRMLGLIFNAVDGRITIFRSTLEALGWPAHYRFLYNRKAKQVAVQNCTAEDAGSHKTPKLNASNSCEIKCMALVKML